MTTAAATSRTLLGLADTNFPPTGTIGYIALLKDSLTSVGMSANPSSDLITTAAPHGLVTGSRIRVAAAGGSVPGGLATTQDYYVIVVSATTLKLAASATLAAAGTQIDLTDAGVGTLTLNEQELSATDGLTVLLNKELTHPAWTARSPITAIGPAAITGGEAVKPNFAVNVTNGDPATLTYKHVLLLFGAGVTATIGSSTGIDSEYLTTETTAQTILNGETKSITVSIKVVPA